MRLIVAALIGLAASGAAAGNPSHADEISVFAKTMAIARTVKESCPGIAPDDRYLNALRQRLHVVEADHLALLERIMLRPKCSSPPATRPHTDKPVPSRS